METGRKVVAAIVGIIVIILLVLLARWVGDQVRQRFFSSNTVINEQTVQVPQAIPTTDLIVDRNATKSATLSAIPATGPVETFYVIASFLALTGLGSVALSKKII